MTRPASHEALAATLFAAVEDGDLDTLRATYGEEAELWSNVSGTALGVDEIVALVDGLARQIPDYHYADVWCEPTPSGFVRTHRASGTSPAGEPFSLAACCVGTVVDGRVARIDEYLDSAALAALGL